MERLDVIGASSNSGLSAGWLGQVEVSPWSHSSCRVVEAAVEAVVAAEEIVPRAESRFQSVYVVEVEAECECECECECQGGFSRLGMRLRKKDDSTADDAPGGGTTIVVFDGMVVSLAGLEKDRETGFDFCFVDGLVVGGDEQRERRRGFRGGGIGMGGSAWMAFSYGKATSCRAASVLALELSTGGMCRMRDPG